MNPPRYVPNELLGRLVGCHLYSVQFVHDYVQLWFDDEGSSKPVVLTCYVPPAVSDRDGDLTERDALWPHALRRLIGSTVTKTTEATGTGIRIAFASVALVLHPSEDELVGPEIATLSGFADKAWMTWRPGEDSFEDL